MGDLALAPISGSSENSSERLSMDFVFSFFSSSELMIFKSRIRIRSSSHRKNMSGSYVIARLENACRALRSEFTDESFDGRSIIICLCVSR